MRFLRVRDAPNSRCHASIPRREGGAAVLYLDRTLRWHGRAHRRAHWGSLRPPVISLNATRVSETLPARHHTLDVGRSVAIASRSQCLATCAEVAFIYTNVSTLRMLTILTMTAQNIWCDGVQPECANCARQSTPCVYDLDRKGKSKKVSQPTFSPPRANQYSYPSSPKHSPGQTGRSNSDVYGRGPLIPQERYTTSTISSDKAPDQHSITFNLENPDQTGIPVIDILNKTDDFVRIRDGTEAVNMGNKTFTLRVHVSSLDLIGGFSLWFNVEPPGFQWPGYRPWSKTITALDWKKSRDPITRAKLAEAVATAIRDLLSVSHN
jgi:hypothetical protein